MKEIIISFFLALALLLTLVACTTASEDENKDQDGDEKTTTTTTARQAYEDPQDDDGDDDDDDDTDDMVDVFVAYGNAVIDGEKDLAWDSAQTVELEVIKIGNRTDAVVRVSTMWDENGFYFYIEIEDDTVIQDGALGDWKQDSFYLYTAEDMDYADTVTASGQFANGVYQFALINSDLEMLPRYGDEAACQSAYKTTDKGFVIEFSYTPTDEMKDDVLTAGHIMYVDFQYNDCNVSGTRDGAWGYYNASDTNFTPYLWAYAKLLAQGEAVPAAE